MSHRFQFITIPKDSHKFEHSGHRELAKIKFRISSPLAAEALKHF